MDISLTELCQELRNWFDRARYIGNITIGPDGAVYCNSVRIGLAEGQYYRVIGSVFSDGVHKYPDNDVAAESFEGAVWAMAVPPTVIKLAAEIAAWRQKYEALDSPAMSPFTAENYFGDYSYSKNAPGNSAGAGSSAASWVSVFRDGLSPWRKLR